MASRLEHLLHPVSKETFFKDFYEKNYLHIQNRGQEYYADILTVEDID
jgi:hypothetical protein